MEILINNLSGLICANVRQVELYCEKLKDLLDLEAKELSIQRDEQHGCHVSGAWTRPASTSEEMLSIIRHGLDNRVSYIISRFKGHTSSIQSS
jgi:hypothetical protein